MLSRRTLLKDLSTKDVVALLLSVNLPDAATTAHQRSIAGNLLELIESSKDVVELGFQLDSVRERLLMRLLQSWKSSGIPEDLLAQCYAFERIPLSSLAPNQLVTVLTNINLPDAAKSTKEHEIGGNLLALVTDVNEFEELGLNVSPLRRRLLLQEVINWKKDGVPWELSIRSSDTIEKAIVTTSTCDLRNSMQSSYLKRPFSTHIVSGSYDHTLRLWPAISNEVARGTDSGCIASIRTENRYIINCLLAFPHSAFAESVGATEAPGVAAVIIGGCDDGCLRIWRSLDSAECQLIIQAHQGAVLSMMNLPANAHLSVSVAPDRQGRSLVATGGGNSDGLIKVWSLSIDTQSAATGIQDAVPFQFQLQCCMTIDASFIVGRKSGIQSIIALEGRVYEGDKKTRLAFSCGADSDSCIAIWEIDNSSLSDPLNSNRDSAAAIVMAEGVNPRAILRGHTGTIFALCQPAFYDDDDDGDEVEAAADVVRRNIIVSGSSDRTVRIWDLNGKSCVRVLYGHTDGVKCLVSVPSVGVKGQLILASGGWDNSIRVWLVPLSDIAPCSNGATETCSSSSGSSSNASTSTVTDTRSNPTNSVCAGEEAESTCVRMVADAHTDSVTCLALTVVSNVTSSSDSSEPDFHLISGSNDMTLKVWSLRQLLRADGHSSTGSQVVTPLPVRILKGHNNGVRCVAVL